MSFQKRFYSFRFIYFYMSEVVLFIFSANENITCSQSRIYKNSLHSLRILRHLPHGNKFFYPDKNLDTS